MPLRVQPIALDALTGSQAQVDAITREIATRLYAVTLNFDDAADADDALDIATVLASVTDEVLPLEQAEGLISTKIVVARRADELQQRLERGELPPATESRVRHITTSRSPLRRGDGDRVRHAHTVA